MRAVLRRNSTESGWHFIADWHAPQYSTPKTGFVLPTMLQEKAQSFSKEKQRSSAKGDEAGHVGAAPVVVAAVVLIALFVQKPAEWQHRAVNSMS